MKLHDCFPQTWNVRGKFIHPAAAAYRQTGAHTDTLMLTNGSENNNTVKLTTMLGQRLKNKARTVNSGLIYVHTTYDLSKHINYYLYFRSLIINFYCSILTLRSF